jgi:hypothetical protein
MTTTDLQRKDASAQNCEKAQFAGLDISKYCGLPFKKGGRSRDGLDCAGLAELFLRENFYPNLTDFPATPDTDDGKDAIGRRALASSDPAFIESKCGDLVLFRKVGSKRITHCEIYLGRGQYLGIMRGSASRTINGLTLLNRLGYEWAGAIPYDDVDSITQALRNSALGDVGTIIALVVSIVISLAAAFLMPKPTMGRSRNQIGRYSFDALITRSQSDIPLPDVLGAVTVAGNSPFTSPADKTLTVTDPTQQKVNKVVILSSGPIWMVDTPNFNLKINGIQFDNSYWKNSGTVVGFELDPAQTKAEAVDGTIRTVTNTPSVSIYQGDHDITVPVDIRASYDRNFPVYGFPGCSYAVFRLIDSNKFQNFNLTTTVQGRLCRKFDANGFVQTSVVSQSLPGADGSKVRFLLDAPDIAAVTMVKVGGVTYSAMSSTAQSGNVYWLNRTKGYIEFLTAPASGATVLVSYTYYVREWTQNPAMFVAYLLTEPIRGKGFDAAVINWASFVTARDYYDQMISWGDDYGATVAPRYQCNYSIDTRKPIQEHMQAVLDSCYSWLFLSNGKWNLKPRAAGTSVKSFDTSSIVEDTFSIEQVDRTDRANQIHVVAHPDTTYNAEDGVVREDLADQLDRAANFGNNGIVPEVLQIPGSPNDPQSERLAEQILRENKYCRWLCSFTTNIQGLPLEVGDIIDVTHPVRTDWVAKLWRIESIGYDEQDRMKLVCSEYVAMAYI